MEKAKQAVSNFMSKDGKHHTTVDEDTRAPVTEQHIRPSRRENVTTAIDKEVHQDHHHTVEQPLHAKEVLPEKHSHNIIPVEHKSFEHDNGSELNAHLNRDAAKYKSSTTTHNTEHTSSMAPTVVGENVHHHVHEHVQPIIHKETVAPEVVHTTVPVHETHHAKAVHHGTSTLPPMSVDEFKRKGGGLGGIETHTTHDHAGAPKPYDKSLQQQEARGERMGGLGATEAVGGSGVTGGTGRTGGLGGTGGTERTGGLGGTGGTERTGGLGRV